MTGGTQRGNGREKQVSPRSVSNSNKGKFAKKSKVAAAPAEDEGDAVI